MIVLILYSSFVIASSTSVISDTGVITLIVKNRPPVIKDIHFNHEIAFEDTTLECISIINDENPDEVKLIHKWYISNVLLKQIVITLQDLKEMI